MVRPVALRSLMRAALCAAGALWIVDLAIMARFHQVPPRMSYLPAALLVLLFCGVLIAVAQWVVLNASLLCARMLTYPRMAAGVLLTGMGVGLFLLTLIVPVSSRLLSGARISKWWPCPRWVAPLALWVLTVYVASLCMMVRRKWNIAGARTHLIGRLIVCLFLCAVAISIISCNILVYPDLYGYLHLTAALGAFIALQLLYATAEPILGVLCGARRHFPRISVWILVILILLCQLAVSPLFMASNAERVFAWRMPYYHRKAVQLIRRIWDLDRDGFSPVLGGGDPSDLDARKVPRGVVSAAAATIPRARGVIPREAALQKRIGALAGRTSRYNILLISVDALRADRLLDDGMARKIVPCMRKLRDRSVLFTRCFSTSTFTPISLPRMMGSSFSPGGENASHPPLAERLRETGYSTASVLNPVMGGGGRAYKRFNYLSRGFDRALFTEHERPAGEWRDRLMDADIREMAVAEIEAHRDKKFFLWLHFIDLHEWPYLNSSVFGSAMSPAEKYDFVLRRTDAEVGRVLNALEEKGIAGSTIVILTADHGQGLGGHGIMTHTQYVYHALIHVPLMIYVPGVASGRVETNVSLLDVAPTVLELAGAKGMTDAEGISLVPALVGGALPPHRPIVSIEARQRSVIEGPWKLIATPEAGAVELFNIDEDPDELRDLSGAASLRDIRDRLQAELDGYADVRVEGPPR